jgi:hypothetical protein
MTISSRGGTPRRVEILKSRSSRVCVSRLVGVGRRGESVIAKWCEVSTGAVEKCFYEDVLPALGVTRLHYYGGFADGNSHIWIFLEDAGTEAVSFKNPRHCSIALQWLAGLLNSDSDGPSRAKLPERGPEHYLMCLLSGRNEIVANADNPALSPEDRSVLRSIVGLLDGLAANWTRVESEYATLPKGVVHGDFKKKNVRLRRERKSASMVAFDWENAGWGIPGIDWWYFHESDCRRYISRSWPDITAAQISRLKQLGGVFWCIDAINWGARSLSLPTAEHMIRSMVFYRSRLSNFGSSLELRL